MSLIKCPECGKVFSDRAAHCPQCGLPTSEALQAIVAGGNSAPEVSPANIGETNTESHAEQLATQSAVGTSRFPKRSSTVLLYVLVVVVVGLIVLVAMVLYQGCNGAAATDDIDTIQAEQLDPDTLSTAPPKIEEEKPNVVVGEITDEEPEIVEAEGEVEVTGDAPVEQNAGQTAPTTTETQTTQTTNP